MFWLLFLESILNMSRDFAHMATTDLALKKIKKLIFKVKKYMEKDIVSNLSHKHAKKSNSNILYFKTRQK
jgi:uncharacterized membrane protein required for colicin V production